MRAKVILAAVVVALAVLAPAVYFHRKAAEPAVPAPEAAVVPDAAPAPAPVKARRVAGPSEQAAISAPAEADPGADPQSPEHPEYVARRQAGLYQMGVSRDPAALGTILKAVHDSDPGIRQAALSATMDFDSKDAIPTLQNEMAWAEDPEEKANIAQAIKFLQLPQFQMDENGTFVQQPVDDSAGNNN